MLSAHRLVLAGSLSLAFAVAFACCGPVDSSPNAPDAATRLDAGTDAAVPDGGAPPDAGSDLDATTPDAGSPDAGLEVDAGDPADSGLEADAGGGEDAGETLDASTGDVDASEPADAGCEIDAGLPEFDAGLFEDAGLEEDASTALDAGMDFDAGQPDAGSTTADAGPAVLVDLTPADLWAMLGGLPGGVCPVDKGFVMIDVHIPPAATRIPCTDAVIDYTQVSAIAAFIGPDLDTPVVLTCMAGGMSRSAGNALIGLGYRNVSQLAGGMLAWQAAGYPLR